MSAREDVEPTTSDWTVGVVVETVEGTTVLRMTEAQADDLRDRLVWLTGDGE